MWVSLAVSTGLGLWGAKKQSDSANKAADQQVQATDKGLALQEQIYNEQKAGMQPYAQGGLNAFGALNSLMGLPATPTGTLGSAVGRNPDGSPMGPLTANQPPLNMSDPRVQHLAQGGSLIDPEVTGTIGAATRSGYTPVGTAVPRAGGSFGGPQMVRLQAPTGEMGEFPEDQAGAFIARGAKRIG